MQAQLTSPVTEVPLERLDELVPIVRSPKVARVRAALAERGLAGVVDDYRQRGDESIAQDVAIQHAGSQLGLCDRPVERGYDGDE